MAPMTAETWLEPWQVRTDHGCHARSGRIDGLSRLVQTGLNPWRDQEHRSAPGAAIHCLHGESPREGLLGSPPPDRAASSHRFEEHIGTSLISRAEYKQISPLIPISRIPTRPGSTILGRRAPSAGGEQQDPDDRGGHQPTPAPDRDNRVQAPETPPTVGRNPFERLGPHRKDNPPIRRHEIVGLQDRILNRQGPNHWIGQHNTLGAQA